MEFSYRHLSRADMCICIGHSTLVMDVVCFLDLASGLWTALHENRDNCGRRLAHYQMAS